jgi:hypothetical protein
MAFSSLIRSVVREICQCVHYGRKQRSRMLRRTRIASLWVVICQVVAVCCGIGRMDSSLLFNADPAAYGTTFGPHVRVATSLSDSRLLPTSVTVQAWIMPLPRDNGLLYTGANDLGQVVGNMARTFSPSRIFAGYSLYCRDSTASMRSCSFFVATSTSSYLEPSCSVPVRQWAHLSGVYNQVTGVADMYLDGSKCATSVNSGGAATISYFLRSALLVGAWMEDAPGASTDRRLQCFLPMSIDIFCFRHCKVGFLFHWNGGRSARLV